MSLLCAWAAAASRESTRSAPQPALARSTLVSRVTSAVTPPGARAPPVVGAGAGGVVGRVVVRPGRRGVGVGVGDGAGVMDGVGRSVPLTIGPSAAAAGAARLSRDTWSAAGD